MRFPPRPLRLSITSWMMVVMLLAWLPLLGFAGVLTWRLLDWREEAAFAALERRAAVGASAIAREVQNIGAAASAVLLGRAGQASDMPELHAHFRRIVANDKRLVSISVTDAAGRQLLSTREDYGVPLPDTAFAELERKVMAGDRPGLSPLVDGRGSGRHLLVLGLPFHADLGEPRLLRVIFKPELLNTVLAEQYWSATWVGAVVDQQGTIIARSRDADRFVGQPAPESVQTRLAAGTTDIFQAVTKDGVPVFTAARPVPNTGWWMIVGEPAADLLATARTTVISLIAVGLLCLGGGLAAAVWLARAIGEQARRPLQGEHVVREIGHLQAQLQGAQLDPLTGLPGRAAFMSMGRQLLEAGARDPSRGAALLFLDLDRFKALNDRLGHAAGDQVLRDHARSEDLPARLGGDEFVLVVLAPRDALPAISQDISARLIQAIDRLPHDLGCSIGLALAGLGEDLEALLRRADHAMYEAKRGGRGRVVVAA